MVSGFWHGANWTFIVWGLLHALYIMPSIIFNTNRVNLNSVAQGRFLPNIKELFQIIITFSLTVFAWIFFRAKDLSEAMSYISRIFSKTILKHPEFDKDDGLNIVLFLLLISILIEWIGREQQYAMAQFGVKWPKTIRWGFYFGLTLVIYYFAVSINTQQFIYFQF